jgi:indolepyruvate ferredoxin oxidoreductase, beta subunit
MAEAKKLGNAKVFNIIVLGVAAKHMDFDRDAWLKVIERTVPSKTVDLNKKAFLHGYESK